MSRQCARGMLDSYLKYTLYQESPESFHTWTLMWVVASVMKRNVWIDKFYYKLYPNLYVALVGPTGIMKTTAGNIGTRHILKKLPNIEIVDGKVTSYHLLSWFEKLSAATGSCECVLYAPEFDNFFVDVNRNEMVRVLTDFYDCPEDKQYRTKDKDYNFKNMCINLLGCSTPEWLTVGCTSEEIAGGYTGRFVYVYEESSDRSIAFPEDFISPSIIQHSQDVIADMHEVANLRGEFVITPQAKAEYLIWYNQRKAEWNDERLIGYFARKSDTIWKISMVLSAMHDDSMIIDETVLHMAWDLLNLAEQKMGLALAGVVDDPSLRYKDTVISFIARSVGHRATRAEILKKFWNKFDHIMLDKIIENCVESKILTRQALSIKGQTHIIYEICDSKYC